MITRKKCDICDSHDIQPFFTLPNMPSRLGVKQKESENINFYDMIYASCGNCLNVQLFSYPDLEEVYFAGGEPFIQEGHYKMLTLLIESGYAKNIHISYNTNLSYINYNIFPTFIYGPINNPKWTVNNIPIDYIEDNTINTKVQRIQLSNSLNIYHYDLVLNFSKSVSEIVFVQMLEFNSSIALLGLPQACLLGRHSQQKLA